MLELQRDDVSSEQIMYLYDRMFFKGNRVYVPDVIAEKYGFNGRRLSCKEVKELLIEDWDRTSRLFRRYALNDCKYLSLVLLFP